MFNAAFNLSADQADYEEIEERIESGIVLRGTNMCILILAIFIASVGLNMNSTAVIIGAMLVSPLMGPIMGIGFSIANYDTNMLKRSATILFFEVIVALATSTVYFSLTPITTAGSPSERLSYIFLYVSACALDSAPNTVPDLVLTRFTPIASAASAS